MSVWGKILGGAAGLALGGPLGALIGTALGHAIDRRIAAVIGPGADAATAKISFTIGVIALAAKMAKADGQVSGSEVQAFKRIFQVPPTEARNVERVFQLAQQDTAGFEAYAQQIAALFEKRAAVLEDLLDALFVIAEADGWVHPEEMRFLEQVAQIFGFTEADFSRIRARHVGPDTASPYAILGVSSDISDKELKSTYRALVRANHPDKLVSQGVPEEFLKVATERLAAINAAYDQVAKERGLV